MTTPKWEFRKRIDRGATASKSGALLVDANNGNLAYFKPGTEREIQAALNAAKIGNALIHNLCAETEPLTWNGKDGVISHNIKTDSSCNYAHATQMLKHNSIESIKKIKNSKLEENTVNMLFFDCLISNTDRHGENWEIKTGKITGDIYGIARLYDHESSQKELPETVQRSKIYWHNSQQIACTHIELFTILSREYPEQIQNLLLKAQNIDCHTDFTAYRLKLMSDAYAKSVSDPQIAANIISNYVPIDKSGQNMFNRFDNSTLKHIEPNAPLTALNSDFEL